jgi:hypothetical protein
MHGGTCVLLSHDQQNYLVVSTEIYLQPYARATHTFDLPCIGWSIPMLLVPCTIRPENFSSHFIPNTWIS